MKSINSLIKDFKDYLRVTKQMIEIAAGNNEYFVNQCTDIPTLKKLAKDLDKDIYIYMRDGTHLVIKTHEEVPHNEIRWV